MPAMSRIAIAKVLYDALNPRTELSEVQELSLSVKEYGQHDAILVYRKGDKYQLIDGARRCRALEMAGETEVLALIMDGTPTEAAIRIIQANSDFFKVGLSPMERSNHLVRTMEANKWTVTETADHLHISQSLASKLISLQKLHPDLQSALHKGLICMERAYAVSQITDFTKQLELLPLAGQLSREQLSRLVHANGMPVELKAKSASFVLPGGFTVTVRGKTFGLKDAVTVLQSVIKELKQAERSSMQLTTLCKVLADKAKVIS